MTSLSNIQLAVTFVSACLLLATYGTYWAVKLSVGQARMNGHLERLNGSVDRNKADIAANAARLVQTADLTEMHRLAAADRLHEDWLEFRQAVCQDIQAALDRWNLEHWEKQGKLPPGL